MKKSSNDDMENLKDPPKDDSSSTTSEDDKKMSSTEMRGMVNTSTMSDSQHMQQTEVNHSTHTRIPRLEEQEVNSVEDMVDILSKDPELISMIERRIGEILLSNDHIGRRVPPSDQVSRSVIQAVVTGSAMAPIQHAATISTQFQMQIPPLPPAPTSTAAAAAAARIPLKHTSRLRAASRSRSQSPSIHKSNITRNAHHARNTNIQHAPPPIKTVSFSSISTPHFHSDDEEHDRTERNDNQSIHLYRRTRSLSRSPPPSPPLYPPSSPIQSHRSSNNSNTATATTTSYTGETTASGDSSVSSTFPINVHNSTNNSSSSQIVHFSAMNPNPQLILEHNEQQLHPEEYHELNHPSSNSSSIPRVSFTVNRTVSFEDQQNQQTSGSRASHRSRSGLSSPSIEPPLSPPLSSSNHRHPHIHFNSTIETITEVAERLRREQDDDPNHRDTARTNERTDAGEARRSRDRSSSRSRGSSRVVHFSAIRRESA